MQWLTHKIWGQYKHKYVNQHTDWLLHSPSFTANDNSCFLLCRWSIAVSSADITAGLQTKSTSTTVFSTETSHALWISNCFLLQVAQAETVLSYISGYSRVEDEDFHLLGSYADYAGNCLLTFRGNISVPYSRVERSKNRLTLDSL